jgi:hypothetical protein
VLRWNCCCHHDHSLQKASDITTNNQLNLGQCKTYACMVQPQPESRKSHPPYPHRLHLTYSSPPFIGIEPNMSAELETKPAPRSTSRASSAEAIILEVKKHKIGTKMVCCVLRCEMKIVRAGCLLVCRSTVEQRAA